MDDYCRRNFIKLNNLWFIDIVTRESKTDFSNWMRGKMVRCKDTMEFQEWLEQYNAFPLSIYLDGVLYTFSNRNESLFFLLGLRLQQI